MLDLLPVLLFTGLAWSWGLGGTRAWTPEGDLAFLPEHLLTLYDQDLWSLLAPLNVPFILKVIWNLLWNLTWGNTPGKMLTKLKVVAMDGAPLPLPMTILRAFTSALGALMGGLGWLLILIHPHKRAFHDLCAGTYVILVGPRAAKLGSVLKRSRQRTETRRAETTRGDSQSSPGAAEEP